MELDEIVIECPICDRSVPATSKKCQYCGTELSMNGLAELEELALHVGEMPIRSKAPTNGRSVSAPSAPSGSVGDNGPSPEIEVQSTEVIPPTELGEEPPVVDADESMSPPGKEDSKPSGKDDKKALKAMRREERKRRKTEKREKKAQRKGERAIKDSATLEK